MKWYLLGGALIVIVVGALLALFSTSNRLAAPGSGYSFPTASSTWSGGTTPSGNAAAGSTGSNTPAGSGFSLMTQQGALVVNDFIHNGTTAQDPQNPSIYYLAGSIGAPAGDFAISYDPSTQFFTIALTKEPIGAARLHAEQFLEAALGIGQGQMCILRYYLGTDIYTNSFYGGKNLGFSFCPGAVQLPQ